MKFKGIILLTTATAFAVSSGYADQPVMPLNVVLIIADDLGVGDVGCYHMTASGAPREPSRTRQRGLTRERDARGGSRMIRTPNIDRLATQGMRATDAHSISAVCTPSRYSMLAGRYYHRYPRNWNGEALIEADRPTIASVFRSAGYATGYFGKVHTGWGEPSEDRKHRQDIDWNSELPRGVLEMGFDKYFGTPFTHNEPPFVFVEDRHVVGLDPADPLVVVPKEIERGNWGWGLSKGAKAAHAARPEDEIDLIVMGKAIDFIKETAGEKPFFINLAFVAPHVPISPSKQFKGTTKLGRYGDFVEQLDWCVGQVLQTLETEGLADNTLVIFTSDNGAIHHRHEYGMGHRANLDWLGQKTDAWEGGVRVPFIVRWPGRVPEGKTFDQLVSLMDIPQTVWAAAGLTPPAGAAPDSLNQLDVFTGKTTNAVRSELYMLGITGQALRSGDWVYIPQRGSCGVTTDPAMTWAMQLGALGQINSDYDDEGKLKPGAPQEQLYNMRDDPRQSTNVVLQYPEKAAELAKRFKEVSKR